MAKLIFELKKEKTDVFEYIVTYHDPKTDNQFTLTTTNDLNEAVDTTQSHPGERSCDNE